MSSENDPVYLTLDDLNPDIEEAKNTAAEWPYFLSIKPLKGGLIFNEDKKQAWLVYNKTLQNWEIQFLSKDEIQTYLSVPAWVYQGDGSPPDNIDFQAFWILKNSEFTGQYKFIDFKDHTGFQIELKTGSSGRWLGMGPRMFLDEGRLNRQDFACLEEQPGGEHTILEENVFHIFGKGDFEIIQDLEDGQSRPVLMFEDVPDPAALTYQDAAELAGLAQGYKARYLGDPQNYPDYFDAHGFINEGYQIQIAWADSKGYRMRPHQMGFVLDWQDLSNLNKTNEWFEDIEILLEAEAVPFDKASFIVQAKASAANPGASQGSNQGEEGRKDTAQGEGGRNENIDGGSDVEESALAQAQGGIKADKNKKKRAGGIPESPAFQPLNIPGFFKLLTMHEEGKEIPVIAGNRIFFSDFNLKRVRYIVEQFLKHAEKGGSAKQLDNIAAAYKKEMGIIPEAPFIPAFYDGQDDENAVEWIPFIYGPAHLLLAWDIIKGQRPNMDKYEQMVENIYLQKTTIVATEPFRKNFQQYFDEESPEQVHSSQLIQFKAFSMLILPYLDDLGPLQDGHFEKIRAFYEAELLSQYIQAHADKPAQLQKYLLTVLENNRVYKKPLAQFGKSLLSDDTPMTLSHVRTLLDAQG